MLQKERPMRLSGLQRTALVVAALWTLVFVYSYAGVAGVDRAEIRDVAALWLGTAVLWLIGISAVAAVALWVKGGFARTTDAWPQSN